MHRGILSLVLLMGATIAQAETVPAARTLTLAQAVALAKTNAVVVRAAQARFRRAEASLSSARANYLPTFMIGGGGSAFVSHGSVFVGGLQSAATDQRLLESQLTLDARLPIYDFGRTDRAVDAAGAGVHAEREAARAAEELAMSDAAAAYFTVLADDALIEAAREALRERERGLELTQGLVAQALRPAVEAMRAEVARDVAAYDVALAESRREHDRALLAVTLALDPATALQLVVPLRDLPDPGERVDIPAAVRANREVLTQQSRVAQGRLALGSSEAARLPALVLQANGALYYDATQMRVNSSAPLKRGSSTSQVAAASLTLTFPLFDPVLNARIRQAEADLKEAGVALAQREQLARLAATQALQALRNASRVLAQAERVLGGALANLSAAESRYQQGLDSLLLLTDAQREATTARAAHIRAQLGLRLANVSFLYAFSRISELLEARP